MPLGLDELSQHQREVDYPVAGLVLDVSPELRLRALMKDTPITTFIVAWVLSVLERLSPSAKGVLVEFRHQDVVQMGVRKMRLNLLPIALQVVIAEFRLVGSIALGSTLGAAS